MKRNSEKALYTGTSVYLRCRYAFIREILSFLFFFFCVCVYMIGLDRCTYMYFVVVLLRSFFFFYVCVSSATT